MVVRIRPARVADAAAIARVHVESWQAAYRGLLPDEYLASLSSGGRERSWQRRVRDVRPRETVVVAERSGTVVGFASAGPSRDRDLDRRDTGELYAIYALEAEWGRGTGPPLHDAVVEELRGAGFIAASLWVLDTNERARRFYERRGWTPDGATKSESYGAPVTELRYRVEL